MSRRRHADLDSPWWWDLMIILGTLWLGVVGIIIAAWLVTAIVALSVAGNRETRPPRRNRSACHRQPELACAFLQEQGEAMTATPTRWEHKAVEVKERTMLSNKPPPQRLEELLKAQARWRTRQLTAATGAVVAVMLVAGGCTSTHPTAASSVATSTATATATPTPTPTPLTISASVTSKRPIIGRTVSVLISTLPNAWITVVVHFSAGDNKKTRRADDTGLRTFWFHTADAIPGYRVRVDIHAYAHGQKRSTRTWFTPRPKPPPPSPPPAPPTSAAPAPATSAPAPSGCYPKASSGNCYEPGEFCSSAEHGQSGIAGDGKSITCENTDPGSTWHWV